MLSAAGTMASVEFEVEGSQGLTSCDCDSAFRRVAVGDFAPRLRVYGLPEGVGAGGLPDPPPDQLPLLLELDGVHTAAVWDVAWHEHGTKL
eukprot:SAG22_NODE_5223_length_1058_cov_1.420229_2_plen_90_part_01